MSTPPSTSREATAGSSITMHDVIHSEVAEESPHVRARFSGGADSTDDVTPENDEPEEIEYGTTPPSLWKIKGQKFARYAKTVSLLLSWFTFTLILMFVKPKEYEPSLLTIPSKQPVQYTVIAEENAVGIVIKLRGAFEEFTDYKVKQNNKPLLGIALQELDQSGANVKNITHIKYLFIQNPKQWDFADIYEKEVAFKGIEINVKENKYQLLIFTQNVEQGFAMEIFYATSRISEGLFLIWALSLFLFIYLYMIFELVHRTFAGVLCCTLMIALTAAIHIRLSPREIFELIDMEIIMGFFGISIIIELLAETGVQDNAAAMCYELAKGHIWPVLNVIFLMSWGLSAIFDDIVLALFLSPICLRICEIMHLNCSPVLTITIIALNVGSTMTPGGSRITNLITNYPYLRKQNLGYFNFSLHMLPVTMLTLVQSYIHLRLQFSPSEKLGSHEPPEIERLKRLTRLWRKVSERIGSYSLDERVAKDTVDTRVRSLRRRIKRLGKMPIPPHNFEEKLKTLRDSFPVVNYYVAGACLGSFLFIVAIGILSYIIRNIDISMGFLAILGALLALSLCNYGDMDAMLSRIEWATMLLLASLLVFAKILDRLGFTRAILTFLQNVILASGEKNHLAVAIATVIWLSALLSTLLHNVPVANMMLPIIVNLSLDEELNLPLMPLVWSLTLGVSLGGNGSIMAGMVNIACSGVASKHGYKITYLGFFKIGFFVMVGNIFIAMCYLLWCHVSLSWH